MSLKDNVKCQQVVAHKIVVSCYLFCERKFLIAKIELSKRVKDDCLGRFLASHATDKRQSVLDLQITLEVFRGSFII